MSETWFIGDTHFGHANILKYEKEARPFANVEEMHETMVERWNKVVDKQDIVWHLGDVAFGKHNIAVIGRMNGIKKLILGNHDEYSIDEYLKYFNSVWGATYWGKFLLTHVPVHPCNLSGKNYRNIHGHLHSKYVMIYDQYNTKTWIEDKRYINASCEQNNLTPINAKEFMEKCKEP